MKERTFFSVFGILLLGVAIAGVGVEFFAAASTDLDNCFLSPHDRGCENNLPIIRNRGEGEENDLEKDVESKFISGSLSDYFNRPVLDGGVIENLQVTNLQVTNLQAGYLSGHFE
ncbi:MAG: hypothetical protein AAGA60_25515 [Cyanobacteria bacterium P01_E01_bin.42]